MPEFYRIVRASVTAAALVASPSAFALEPGDLPEDTKLELREVLPEGLTPPPVAFAPTMNSVVARMLELAKVTKNDFVLDLGSGDGRIPIAAAKLHGARGLGIEIVTALIQRSRADAKAAGVDQLVEFRQEDLFKTPIRDASVVTLYLPVAVNNLLRPRFLKELRPGTRIVAHEFPMTEWPADVIERLNHRTLYLWIVPAQVAGEWQMEADGKRFTVTLGQDHQVINGLARIGEHVRPLRELRLQGDAIQFEIEIENDRFVLFHGRVNGDTIEPRREAGAPPFAWRATRSKAAGAPGAR